MQDSNVPNNPLAASIDHSAVNFDADIYQASAMTLYWINTDPDSVFLGSIVRIWLSRAKLIQPFKRPLTTQSSAERQRI